MSADQPPASESRLYCFLPLLMGCLVFANSLGGDFVHDDLSAIRYNKDVTSSGGGASDDTGSSKSSIWSNDFWGTALSDVKSHKSYRPLTVLSFRLMEGGEERVGRQCFRWASSVVLAWASLTAKEHGIAALPVALLFDVTTTSHVKLDDKRIRRAPDSSPMTCWKMSQFHRFTGTGIAIIALTLWRVSILNGQLPTFSDQDNPMALSHHFLTRVLSLLYLPAVNMGLLLAPVSLSYDWQTGSIPAVVTWSDGRNALSLLFYICVALVAVVAFNRTNKIVIWSLLVMTIPMVPCSNLFYAVGFVVAERLLYMPSLGFCLLVGHGLDNLLIISESAGDVNQGMARAGYIQKIKRSGRTEGELCWPRLMRRLIFISTVVTATSLLTKTLVRNEEWSSRKTLFSSGLRAMPNNAKIHYNYANLQRDLGDWDQAMLHYRRAIQLWPSYSSAHNNLGTLLLGRSAGPATDIERKKLVDEAERHFLQALAVHFRHVHARYNLAVINICYRHNLDEAISLLIECLSLDAKHKPARKLLNFLTIDRNRSPASVQGRHQVNETGSTDKRSDDLYKKTSLTMNDLLLILLEN